MFLSISCKMLHLSLGCEAPIAVQCGACSLFDEQPNVFGSRIHQLIDTPLLDHGVSLGADAGAEK
jgi:hypothetical protein